jgi:membrane protease YdiL (CAAX protease family)
MALSAAPVADRPVRSGVPPVGTFFALALVLSWAAWIPFAASQAGRIGARVPAELIWLSEYGPSVAAILLAGWLDGGAGVRRLLAGLGRWRVAPRWYLTAILLPPAAALAAIAIRGAVSGQWPDWTLLGGWDGRFVDRTRAFSPSVGLIDGLVSFMEHGPVETGLVLVALAVTNGGLSEEIGWRGYGLPRLVPRFGWLGASVVVGIMWGAWHTGTAFWQSVLTAGPAEGFRFVAGYIGQYLLLVVPLAVLYGWLYRVSGGSLLLMVLLHACYNITITLAASAWVDFPLGIMVAILWLVAVAVGIRLARAPR